MHSFGKRNGVWLAVAKAFSENWTVESSLYHAKVNLGMVGKKCMIACRCENAECTLLTCFLSFCAWGSWGWVVGRADEETVFTSSL